MVLLITIMKDQDLVKFNIKTHNNIAKRYEKTHTEIYNKVEQERLRKSLIIAKDSIKTEDYKKTALDFGCGAGNLTKHLTDIGCEVLAADVSQGFLDLISSKVFKEKVETVKLNGKDLSNLENNSVDMVCMYSVLHHIPDYLSLISEFMRVLKRGGVLYMDHEASESFWNKDSNFNKIMFQLKKTRKGDFKKFMFLNNYLDFFIRRFINPKFQREGDIHVWQDDHIEWAKIKKQILDNFGEIILEEDYLLYKKGYDVSLFRENEEKYKDTHLLIARKK